MTTSLSIICPPPLVNQMSYAEGTATVAEEAAALCSPDKVVTHLSLVEGNYLRSALIEKSAGLVVYDPAEAERLLQVSREGSRALGISWAGARAVFDLFSELTPEECKSKWGMDVDEEWLVSKRKLLEDSDASEGIKVFTLSRSPVPMWWIVDHIVVPGTASTRQSLLFLLFGLKLMTFSIVGEADCFHSYTWSERFADTYSVLDESLAVDAVRIGRYIWWDIFCQNQHDMGDVGKTFKSAISQINTVFFSVPILSSPQALGRVWCLFELTHALLSPGITLKLVNLSRRQCRAYGDPLSHIKSVHDAEAKFESDKDMLLSLMDAQLDGGCEAANLAIKERFVPIFLRQCLLDVVVDGSLDMLVEMKQKNDISISSMVREDGTTLLHLAARHGHVSVAQYLIEQGADVNAENYLQICPLHEASRSGHASICELLLEVGADVNATDDDGETALHMAANLAVLEALLAHHADPTIENQYDDFTPRMVLCIRGAPAEMISRLEEEEGRWREGSSEETSDCSGSDSDSSCDCNDIELEEVTEAQPPSAT